MIRYVYDRYQACRQAQTGRARVAPLVLPEGLSNTRQPTKRDHVRMQCPSCMQCPPLFGPLCASSHQRGRRKLPRTVRMSYRLNGLPALPPPDAGVAHDGAVPLDAHFPSVNGALVCKCFPDARCVVLPMQEGIRRSPNALRLTVWYHDPFGVLGHLR